jgi:integrase
LEPLAYSALPNGNAPITVGDVVSCFLSHHPIQTRAQTVLHKRIRMFTSDYGRKPIADCTPLDLITWLDAHPEFKSDWTRLGVVNNIKRPFNWAVKTARMIPYNPFECVTHPEGEPAREMYDDERQTILRNSKAVFRRIVIFLRFSGSRPSEGADAEWKFYDERLGTLTLWKHKTIKTRKKKLPRVIVLHPTLIKLFSWIRRNRPHERWIFVNARGTQWNRYTLCKRIKRLRKKIGRKDLRSLGGLRHSMGCDAVENEVPLPLVAEMLGHASIRTTMRYVHMRGKTDRIRSSFIKALQPKK